MSKRAKKELLYYQHVEYANGKKNVIPIYQKGKITYIGDESMHPAARGVEEEIRVLHPGVKIGRMETLAMRYARLSSEAGQKKENK